MPRSAANDDRYLALNRAAIRHHSRGIRHALEVASVGSYVTIDHVVFEIAWVIKNFGHGESL